MASAHRASNKQQYLRKLGLGLCRHCGKSPPKQGRVLCANCGKTRLDRYYANKEHQLQTQRKYKRRLREETMAAYGGAFCWCCGETRDEFLTFDHMHNNGAAHRREIGTATQSLMIWLRRNNYPNGFRVLCMNCNFAIGIKGYCPHEKE